MLSLRPRAAANLQARIVVTAALLSRSRALTLAAFAIDLSRPRQTMVGVCPVHGDGCRLDHAIVVRNTGTRWLQLEMRNVSQGCFDHQTYEVDPWDLNVALGSGSE